MQFDPLLGVRFRFSLLITLLLGDTFINCAISYDYS